MTFKWPSTNNNQVNGQGQSLPTLTVLLSDTIVHWGCLQTPESKHCVCHANTWELLAQRCSSHFEKLYIKEKKRSRKKQTATGGADLKKHQQLVWNLAKPVTVSYRMISINLLWGNQMGGPVSNSGIREEYVPAVSALNVSPWGFLFSHRFFPCRLYYC